MSEIVNTESILEVRAAVLGEVEDALLESYRGLVRAFNEDYNHFGNLGIGLRGEDRKKHEEHLQAYLKLAGGQLLGFLDAINAVRQLKN